jgi:copper chaperone CopZ
MKVTLHIKDMDCKHCVASIESALQTEKITAEISLAQQTVIIDEADATLAINVIEQAGYHPLKQSV